MIQPQTYLRVADNTGARELMCIRVLGGGKQRAATVGDIIIAVVKDATPNMPVKLPMNASEYSSRRKINSFLIINSMFKF